MTTTVKPVDSIPAGQQPVAAAPAPKKRDVRYIALRNFAISISAFNIFGYTVLGFEQPFLWPFIALAVGYTTEFTFETISARVEGRLPNFRGRGARGVYEFMLPAHITSLACNMLLYANNTFWPIAFGIVVAVSAKYALKAPIAGRMRHFMNPSNFGISVTLLALGGWVSIAPPYQFTEWANTYFRIMIPVIIITAGTVINAKLTGRIPLIVGWLGGFAIQAAFRHLILGVQLNTALAMMTGTAFVLFTNYMITDPGTTPTKPRMQFIFGASIAFVYALLMYFNITYTLFFATCLVCGARGLGWWATVIWQRRLERVKAARAPVADELARPGLAAGGEAVTT
jgi:hypothetical protein